VRQDHTQPNVRKIRPNGGKRRSKIGITRHQNNLLNLQLIGTTGRTVHTKGKIYISLFLFKLPDSNLVLPRSCLAIDESRGIASCKSMLTKNDLNPSGL